MDFRDFFFSPRLFPFSEEYAGARSFINSVTQTANPPDQSCKNGRSAIHHKSPLFCCNRAFQGKWATTFNYSSEGPRPWTQVTTYFRVGTWESQDGLSLYLLWWTFGRKCVLRNPSRDLDVAVRQWYQWIVQFVAYHFPLLYFRFATYQSEDGLSLYFLW